MLLKFPKSFCCRTVTCYPTISCEKLGGSITPEFFDWATKARVTVESLKDTIDSGRASTSSITKSGFFFDGSFFILSVSSSGTPPRLDQFRLLFHERSSPQSWPGHALTSVLPSLWSRLSLAERSALLGSAFRFSA